MAAFPGNPTLAERDRTDQANGLYADLFERGDLIITAGQNGKSSASLLREAYRRYGRPGVIVCDRYRAGRITGRAESASGIRADGSRIYRGFGWKDGSGRC